MFLFHTYCAYLVENVGIGVFLALMTIRKVALYGQVEVLGSQRRKMLVDQIPRGVAPAILLQYV